MNTSSNKRNVSIELLRIIVGRSRSYIANMIRLLKLCDSVQKDLIEGDLTVGQARPLLALRSAAQQMEAAERIKEGELSARQAEALVKSMQNKTPKAKAAKPQSTAEVRALMDRLKLSLGSPVNIKERGRPLASRQRHLRGLCRTADRRDYPRSCQTARL